MFGVDGLVGVLKEHEFADNNKPLISREEHVSSEEHGVIVLRAAFESCWLRNDNYPDYIYLSIKEMKELALERN